MLTQLMCRLPPDSGYPQNRMTTPVSTNTNYAQFQKPMTSHNGLLFSNGFPPQTPDATFSQGNSNKPPFAMPSGFAEMPRSFDAYRVPQQKPELGTNLQIDPR